MYFSKNSRYVLSRARCIPPSFCFLNCLKGTTRNLSAKPPKDDPTKPPLRLNIPDDSGKKSEETSGASSDAHKIHKKEFVQPRSKSLLSKPSNKNALTKPFDEDIINTPRSESDTRFKSNESESHSFASGKKADQNFSTEDRPLKKQNLNKSLFSKTRTDIAEGSGRAADELSVTDSVENDATMENSEYDLSSKLNSNEGKIEMPSDGLSERKALYIVIDVPEKQSDEDSKNVNPSSPADPAVDDSSAFLKLDYATLKNESIESAATSTPKLEWHKNANSLNRMLKRKSKSLTSLPHKSADAAQPEPKVKFQVHEIDEAATYVLYLKFKKNLRGKTFAVGRIPEKELKTRTESLSEDEGQLKNVKSPFSRGKTYKSLGKDQVTTVEDPMEPVKYETAVQNQNKPIRKELIDFGKKLIKFPKSSSVEIVKPVTSPKKERKVERMKDSEEKSEIAFVEPPVPKADSKKAKPIAASQPKIAPHQPEIAYTEKESVSEEAEDEVAAAAIEATAETPKAKYSKYADSVVADTKAKVEHSVSEVAYTNELHNQPNTAKLDDQPATSDDKYYRINDNDAQTNYHQEQYQQQVAAYEASQQEQQQPYDPDAKEYYYYHVHGKESQAVQIHTPDADRPHERPERPPKNNTNFQKPYGKKKKTEKNSKTDGKKGKNVKFSGSSSKSFKGDNKISKDPVSFQTSANVVKISSETSVYPMRFCAAYPPALNEVMIGRGRSLGLRKREAYFNPDTKKISYNGKAFESTGSQKDDGLSENSILFSNRENSEFNCPPFFNAKKTTVLSVLAGGEDDAPKMSDNMVNMANEGIAETKGEPSLDTLTMMKKVKEIVNFDLNNAVKIFEGKKSESESDVKSVIVYKNNGWELDEKALERCISERKAHILGETAAFCPDSTTDNIAERKNIDNEFFVPKYLPGKKENDVAMKLKDTIINSVITFNPAYGTFQINQSDLEEAVRQSRENFDNLYFSAITPKLELFLKDERESEQMNADVSADSSNAVPSKNQITSATLEMKSGDSILVFDELTQTWKVDFSILEKREEQLRQEELTKRSELILETIEKLEKSNISNIPKPTTRDKKIFDYTSEEWKEYKSDERPSNSDRKSTKEKSPFKEPDAEEIRKKNSDLYENLFVANKKDKKITKDGKEAPGLNVSGGKKETASKEILMAKDAKQGKTEPETPAPGLKIPPKDSEKPIQKNEKDVPTSRKEEDHFWESFLKNNVLPFDRPEPPKPPPIKKQPDNTKIKAPPFSGPSPPASPPKKIEEPKFRFPLPFGWDKKINPPKERPPIADKNKKPDSPTAKTPASKPKSSTSVTKKEDLSKSSTQNKSPPSPADQKKESPPANTLNKKPSFITGITKNAPFNIPPSQSNVSKDSSKKESSVTKPPKEGLAPISKNSMIDKKKSISEKINISSGSGKPESKSTKNIATYISQLNLPIPKKSGETLNPSPTSPPSPPPVSPQNPSPVSPQNSPEKAQTNPSLPPTDPDPKKTPPASSGGSQPTADPPKTPPSSGFPSVGPASYTDPSPVDPRQKTPPTIGAPRSDNTTTTTGKVLRDAAGDISDLKTKGANHILEKREKSPSEHYISENIVRMSKSTEKDMNSKARSSKFETVKVNVTSDKRMPSKITEINLNKQYEKKVKEPLQKTNLKDQKNPSTESFKKDEKFSRETRFYKNFEKYKTPFSDPEYEEKSMKINSDIESNPNLKKLDNWNKTLVLHDIVKPPENIETWLKDETDKMATLLLKVLQEAAEGKPRKKSMQTKGRPGDRIPSKGNPYDNIRKKQETTPENFLLKVRAVNLALEAEKKSKLSDASKPSASKISETNDRHIPVQSAKTVKPSRTVDAVKVQPEKNATLTHQNHSKIVLSDSKLKLTTETALETIDSSPRVITDLTDDVPGPEVLKKISNTWKLFPVIGCQLTIFTLLKIFQLVNLRPGIFSSTQSDKSRPLAFNKLFAKYGPIVNLQGPLSGNVILIHKPEHLTAVFEQDGVSSSRSLFDSLEQSRRESEEKILSAPVLTDWSKPEWNALRKVSCDPMVKGCEKFFGCVELAGDSLVNNVRRNRNGQNMVSDDFMCEIKRWSLEGLCNVLFARSFGFLESRSNNPNWLLEPDKIFLGVEEATECLSKCEKGFQMWRIIATPSLLGLGQAYRSLAAILSKQIHQSELSLKNKSELTKEGNHQSDSVDLTYIESMLLFDGMAPEEITCNLVDTLLVGTNAMASSLGFLLYHLAQNLKIQQRLLKEIKEALPNKSSRLDYQKLHSLKYLQACLKESLRLNTPFPLFFRLLQNDILLSNYLVPKGTYVVMDSRVSCMKEQIFDEPEKFIPERWLNEDKWMQNSHPFSSFPLCHGPRSDLAKRIIEMQLCSCVSKIVRNFEIEYHFGEISGTHNVISLPDKPLKLNFIERHD